MTTTTFQIFAKAPVPGRVKTRLVPPLIFAGAAKLHARMIERAAVSVHEAVERLGDARGELWCAPDSSDATLARIAREHRLSLRVQADGDLGHRMRAALSTAMPGRAILIGTDIPALDGTRLAEAADALVDHDRDAVIIPSADGGYVLIGCRDRVPDCFDAIDWSTPAVMQQTRDRLAASGSRWIELPALWDVDTADDLRRMAADPLLRPLLDDLETADGFPLVFNETLHV